MSIRGRLFAAVLASAFIAAPAEAQVRTVLFGVSAGPSIPVGDFSDTHDVGFHVQGSLHFGAPALPFGVRGDFMYQRNNASADAFSDINIIAGILNAVFPFGPSPAAPYAIAGAGVYSIGNGDTETEIGVNGGLGFQFGLGNLAAFAEARFHHLFVSGDRNAQFIPISIGVIF